MTQFLCVDCLHFVHSPSLQSTKHSGYVNQDIVRVNIREVFLEVFMKNMTLRVEDRLCDSELIKNKYIM